MKKRFPALVQNLPSNPLPDSLEVDAEARRADRGDRDQPARRSRRGSTTSSTAARRRRRILSVAKVIESFFLIAVLVLLVGLDASDREHDPALDLLAAA